MAIKILLNCIKALNVFIFAFIIGKHNPAAAIAEYYGQSPFSTYQTLGECFQGQAAGINSYYASIGVPNPFHPFTASFDGCVTNIYWCPVLPGYESCPLTGAGGHWDYFCGNSPYGGDHCTPNVDVKPREKDRLTGNPDVKTKVCGSLIDQDKQTVSEQVFLNSPDFYLNYSSEFNPSINRNRSFYKEIELPTGFSGQYIATVRDLNFNEIAKNTFSISNPIVINFPWDEIAGNTSTNPIMSKGTFSVTVDKKNLISPSFLAMPITVNRVSSTGAIVGSYATTTDSIEFNSTPMVGFPLNLSVYHPEEWGLGGWTMSHHHYFDRVEKILYSGAGEKIKYGKFKTVTLPIYGLVDLVSSHFSNEIYVFDQLGVHLETRTKILGKVKYKFNYASGSNKLTGFIDINNKLTSLVYDGSGLISKIQLSNGIEAQITNSSGLISAVTESGDNTYVITYGSKKEITTFEKPNAEITTFSYSADGSILSETKNTNRNQFFTRFMDGIMTYLGVSTNLGHAESTDISVGTMGIGTYATKKNSDGTSTDVTSVFSSNKTIESGLNTFNYSMYGDEMWEDYYNEPYPTGSIKEGGQNIGLTANGYSTFTYSDPADPFSLTQVVHNDTPGAASSYLYNQTTIDIPTKTITHVSIDGRTSTMLFDNKERITQISAANQYPIDYTYNLDGRLAQVKKGSQYTNYSYNTNGTLASETNSNGQTTSYTYDNLGNVLQKTLPNLDTIKFEYTNGQEIKKITTPSNEVHNFSFSVGDYLSQILTPASKQTVFTYDDDKKITKITKPSSKEILYNYFSNRPLPQTIVTPDGTVTFHNYDPQSRIRSVTSADGIKTDLTWTHTTLQEQVWYDTDSSVIATLTNTFDNNFSLSDIKLNGNFMAYFGYDTSRRVNMINSSANYTYSGTGYTNLLTVSSGGLAFNYSSEESASGDVTMRQVTSNATDPVTSSSLFLTMRRSFNNFGNATDFTHTVMNNSTSLYDSYYSLVPTYDANNRLTQVSKDRKSYVSSVLTDSTDFVNQYSYPAGSNNNIKIYTQRPSVSASPTKQTFATHGVDDQISALTGTISRTYVHTDDGELQSYTDSSGTTQYKYDVFGNLKKVTRSDGKIIEYKVDAFNRRVKKIVNGVTTEYYLWYDQLRIAAVLDASKVPVLQYIYGPESAFVPSYVIKSSVLYKILHDPGLGSVQYVINPQNSNIMQAIEYDELGNIVSSTNPDFQPVLFAGGLYDSDTGLTRFGARDYDSTVGRFTTRDPIGFDGGDTNLYAYVGGSPMSYVDPEGTFWVPVVIGVGLFLNPTYLDTAGAALTEIYDGMKIAGAGVLAQIAPLLTNNRYLRIGEGKFPEPYSQRISIGNTPGKKFEIGISPKGRIDVKLGGSRTTIRNGSKDICPKE